METKLDSFKEKILSFYPELPKEILKLKGKEFYLKFKEISKTFGDNWNIEQDYNFYHDRKYLLECIWSFMVSSEGAVKNSIKYFNEIGISSNVSVLDYYNGCGLTTQILRERFKNVEYYSTVNEQIKASEILCDHLSPINEAQPPYDIVYCLETIEHFRAPMELTQTVMDMSSKYLVETTAFCSPQHFGHFKDYIWEDKIVSGRVASRRVHDLIRTEFTQVFSGFNGLPRIWKRK